MAKQQTQQWTPTSEHAYLTVEVRVEPMLDPDLVADHGNTVGWYGHFEFEHIDNADIKVIDGKMEIIGDSYTLITGSPVTVAFNQYVDDDVKALRKIAKQTQSKFSGHIIFHGYQGAELWRRTFSRDGKLGAPAQPAEIIWAD